MKAIRRKNMAHRVMGRSFGKNGRRIFFRYIYRVLGFQATDSSRHSLQYHLSIYRSKKRFIQGPILPLRLLSLPPPLGPLLLRFFPPSCEANRRKWSLLPLFLFPLPHWTKRRKGRKGSGSETKWTAGWLAPNLYTVGAEKGFSTHKRFIFPTKGNRESPRG